MLGKLTKYEIKSTANTFLLIYAAVLVLAVVNRVFYGFGMMDFSNLLGRFDWIGGLVTGLFTFVYILMIIAMFVAVTITVITRFYRNMFGSEGYLMHTLPVKPWQHILSKMLASSLWMLGSLVVTFLSIAVLLSHRDIYAALAEVFPALSQALREFPVSLTPMFVDLVILMIFSIFGYQLPIYVSICIGQLWQKHRVLGAFCSYFVLNIITNILSGIVGIGSSLTYVRQMENMMYTDDLMAIQQTFTYLHRMFLISIAMSVVLYAVYFFVSNYILAKKIDLE